MVALLRKRIVVLMSCFMLTTMLGVLYVFTAIPVYRSEATVRVGQEHKDTIKSIGEAMAPMGWSQDETYATEGEVIKSTPLAAALVDTLDLTQLNEFKPGSGKSLLTGVWHLILTSVNGGKVDSAPAPEKAPTRGMLIGQVLKRLSVKRQGKSQLLKVGMEARDPEEAKTLLEGYLGLYLDRDLREKRRPLDGASNWINGEVERVEKQLMSSIARAVKFTGEHGVVAMDGEANHVLRFFNKAAEGLVRSKENRVQLEALQAGVGQPGSPILPSGVERMDVEKMREQLASLESDYSQLSEIYSSSYPKLVLMRKQIAYHKDKVAEMEKGAVSAALDSAEQQEKLQQEAFEHAKQNALDSNSGSIEYAVLKKEVETNERLYNLLLEKSKELALDRQIVSSRLAVIDPPAAPRLPIRPKKAQIIIVSALLGLIGGIGFAFAVEQLDGKIRSSEDLDRKLGLWTLGEIPDIRKLRGALAVTGPKNSYEFISYESPKSPVADAIRNLKLSVFLSAPASSLTTIAICSSLPSEGKSFIAVSLGATIASGGKRVLLVDADLRRKGLTKVFDDREKLAGLSSVLVGSDTKLESVVRRSKVPGLFYLPAGPTPPNPPGLLESARMARIMHHLTKAFDVIILDCPPAVGLPDAQIVMSHADGAILVARLNYVTVDLLRQARDKMLATNKPLLGVVLNMSDRVSAYYRKYNYYKYYS